MLKTEINIDRPMPHWAENYLMSNDLYVTIRVLKKDKRCVGLPLWMHREKREWVLDAIYCNAKGNVVFKWNTAQEKTMFMLKWA